MASRGELLWSAQVAEQAELYTELTLEERNSFSIAANNIVRDKRASWRNLSAIYKKITKEENTKESRKEMVCKNFIEQIERELKIFCLEVKELTTSLIESSSLPESRMFFHKMRADYCKYMAEVTTGEEKEENVSQILDDYEKIFAILQTEFSAGHPICIRMALSYSVFIYEIQNEPERAIQMAQKAFDDAKAELDTLDEKIYNNYKESTLQLAMLRDNIVIWTSDLDGPLKHV